MSYKDKNKQRQYQRERSRRIRAEFFAGAICASCGRTERLELDHIDRKNKIGHGIWSWTIERRLAEIEKCQILCRWCHIEKTKYERGYQGHPKHGWGYGKGCRCDVCTTHHRIHADLYRHKRKLDRAGSAPATSTMPLWRSPD